MKRMIYGIAVFLLAAIAPLAYADGYADYNITFDCFAIDPDSPNNAITTQTTRIMLGVEIKNNSKTQVARLVNVQFLDRPTTHPVDGDASIVSVVDGTRVGYTKPSPGGGVSNIQIPPGGIYTAVCNTAVLASTLAEGKYILKARLFQVYRNARGYYVYNGTPLSKVIDVVG